MTLRLGLGTQVVFPTRRNLSEYTDFCRVALFNSCDETQCVEEEAYTCCYSCKQPECTRDVCIVALAYVTYTFAGKQPIQSTRNGRYSVNEERRKPETGATRKQHCKSNCTKFSK